MKCAMLVGSRFLEFQVVGPMSGLRIGVHDDEWTCRGRKVWTLGVPGRFDASNRTEATLGTMSRLVRTESALGVRAERIGAPLAVGRLVTLAKLQAVDSSCTAMECLLTSTGLWGIGDQLL